jgi:nucleoside-diphosphate-sugar epimerase
MSSILVTGASGFIGSHLIPRLREQGHEVFVMSSRAGDVAEQRTWASYPRAEVVIHLAGKAFVPASWEQPAAFIRCNLLGTVGALDYCVRHSARLVFVSSYLYGRPESLPIRETAPLLANNPYALSKKLAEEACQFYAASLGAEITILRPFNVYGAGQSDSFLVPSIIRQVRTGRQIRVKDLEPKRDYVYVDDVVRAILAAAGRRGENGVFNIGSGVSHSVQDLIRVVQQVMGTDIPVQSDGERRKDEVMDTVADIAQARRHLGWQPEWTLDAGVRQMIEALA